MYMYIIGIIYAVPSHPPTHIRVHPNSSTALRVSWKVCIDNKGFVLQSQ